MGNPFDSFEYWGCCTAGCISFVNIHSLKELVLQYHCRPYLTVVDSGQELVAAQRKLWSVVAVDPFTSVVQMLEIMWRHCRRKNTHTT